MFPEREKRMMSAFAFGFGAAKIAGEAAAIAAAETPVRNVRREIKFGSLRMALSLLFYQAASA